MKTSHLIIAPALVAAIALSGCHDNTARSDYPDRSQETKAEADAIRSDGERREQLVDRDLAQTRTSLGFAEKQNADKAQLERERIKLERDQKVQPLEARKADTDAKAKRDCERVDEEARAKAATVSEEEATRIKADAVTKMAEIRRDAAGKTTELDADIRAANQAAQERLAKVDENETKEQITINAKRAEAERQARQDKLQIQADTTAKLDRVGKDSAKRRDQERAREDAVHENDQRITAEVKQEIARQGDATRAVTVSTDAGVVVLGGSVPSQTTKQKVVGDAQKISGVVRVDDRIAVH